MQPVTPTSLSAQTIPTHNQSFDQAAKFTNNSKKIEGKQGKSP